jgi:DNA invertase Pin-like site-specific DNA recombinase
MKKVKYIRCSTPDQNPERQKTNAKEFDKLYIDFCSGALRLSERKEGKKLLADIDGGLIGEIHISSVDRLGRSILEIVTILEYFLDKGVNLFVENLGMKSLINGKPNPTFKLICLVLGNVSEMEREIHLERIRQGVAIAKAKGVYKGRLYGTRMSEEQFLEKHKKVVKELNAGQSLRRAAALCGCSAGTVQKVKRLLNTTQ